MPLLVAQCSGYLIVKKKRIFKMLAYVCHSTAKHCFLFLLVSLLYAHRQVWKPCVLMGVCLCVSVWCLCVCTGSWSERHFILFITVSQFWEPSLRAILTLYSAIQSFLHICNPTPKLSRNPYTSYFYFRQCDVSATERSGKLPSSFI